MEYVRLGHTGMKVAALCLGTMQFGWTAGEDDSIAVLDAYASAGGNFIDTADVYTRWHPGNPGGVAEQIIGRWMKERGNRHDLVVATKVRGAMGTGPNDHGLSRKHILDAVDASLRRLQTDYIDLYQTHSFDDTPIEETLDAMNDLVRAGKVRYIGASNYPAWRLMEALWKAAERGTARYDTLQPHYNLVHRAEFERELQDVCRTFQIGVIPYSPLAGGFLTGKYRRNQAPPEGARSQLVQRRAFSEHNWTVLDAVEQVANETGAAIASVAIAWLMRQPGITAPIIGANSPEQLAASLAAPDVTLSDEQLRVLDGASRWDRD